MESQDLPCDNLPFKDHIYFIAAIVDPRFNLRWISVDVTASSDMRDSVREELTGMNNYDFYCLNADVYICK